MISHQSALALHELSDALPEQIHLSVPLAWRHRRFRLPPGVVLHHADVAKKERTWVGAVPITSAARTLNDCARSGVSPEVLRQGAREALGRGWVVKGELKDVVKALKPFGGLAAWRCGRTRRLRRSSRRSNKGCARSVQTERSSRGVASCSCSSDFLRASPPFSVARAFDATWNPSMWTWR